MSFRVLHIDSENGWRGGQRQTEILITGLIDQGISCHFAGPKDSPLIKKLQNRVPTLSLKTKGINVLSAAYKVKVYCRNNSIDLIDCQSSGAHSIAYFAALMGNKAKIVVHRRVDYLPNKSWSSKKYFSPTISRYIAISNYIADILAKYGIDKSKISVARSAVNAPSYNESDQNAAKEKIYSQHNLTSETTILLNVAALSEQKNHFLLLAAIAILKKRNEKFHLFICGDGPLRSEVMQQIGDLNLKDHVTLTGHINHVRDYFLAADIFVLSSRDEGLGTSLLDAALYQLPIAATKVGGIPEIIIDNKTGLLSDSDDEIQLTENINRLIENSDLAKKLSYEAKEHVLANFSPNVMVSENKNIYCNL